jgi:hypothetical protein
MDTLELQQAFVDIVLPAGEGDLTLRLGRQMLLLGAQRLVSPLPWGNALRHWEGITAELELGEWTFDALATAFVNVPELPHAQRASSPPCLCFFSAPLLHMFLLPA